jgi:hypothetical protein
MRAMILPLLAALAAVSLHAQQASPYIPVDDETMPYVEHLIRAGVIADPDPLTRPLRRGDVVAALQAADTTGATAAVRATVRALLARLVPASGSPSYRADLYLQAAAANQDRRDPLRPVGDGYVAGRGGMRLSAAFGPVALSSHAYIDQYLQFDPDYTGNKSKNPPGRLTDAYISVQGKYGEAFLGALNRNWGPTGLDGFLTSPYAYSYDHLMLRAGTRAVRAEVLTTQLDDMTDTAGVVIHRYWASARVLMRPWKWMVASVDNATLWYGPTRTFEPRFLNPLKLSFITVNDDNLSDSQNSLLNGSLRLALPRGIVLQGSLLVDAISGGIDAHAPDPLPTRGAIDGVADIPVAHGMAVRVWTGAVSAYAYRAPSGPQNTVMLRGVGLGENFADYWETGVTVSLVPWPFILLRPELVFLKQGEGDFRLPNPPLPVAGPVIFEGVIERTLRLGLAGEASILRRLDLDLNAGVHRIENAEHQTGVSRTRFVGRVALTYRFGGAVRLPE